MNPKLQSLSTDELVNFLNQERRKFLLAIDYGATGSDLEEIRDKIKELENIISSRDKSKDQPRKSENKQSVA